MRCLECGTELDYLCNEHLLTCSGLTLQEYAIRNHLPLELIVRTDQVNSGDDPSAYTAAHGLPSDRACAVMKALRIAGLLRTEGRFAIIDGEIRRLDQLLWDLQYLGDYGFQYRQEYVYDDDSHRIVAKNRIKALREHVTNDPFNWSTEMTAPELTLVMAVLISHVAELQAGYLFIPLPERKVAERLAEHAARNYSVRLVLLDTAAGADTVLLRSETRGDASRMLEILEDELSAIPSAIERFYMATPEVTVAKEVVFDSAHFITDHPAKCSNLHGGRYVLQVKVKGRIDPITGCVIDFGYLKRVVNRRVVDRFDHHTLNYTATELAWRSSTEMLCVYIWDQLLDYLPGLVELQLYETTQSWCCYTGPSLDERRRDGPAALQSHFRQPELGRSTLRELAYVTTGAELKMVRQ
jgi:6-pyruvoyl tetrahydropterin synthase/QueD family protein